MAEAAHELSPRLAATTVSVSMASGDAGAGGIRSPRRHLRNEGHMIERKERKPYWRHTKWQVLTSLIPFLITLIVLPLYADQLNARKFLGFPLGYFLACHGLIAIAVVTVVAYINRQDAIDHWHGAHEDA
jgi:putative solute:sodium symporter small subunit